jgi:hypothetical protein
MRNKTTMIDEKEVICMMEKNQENENKNFKRKFSDLILLNFIFQNWNDDMRSKIVNFSAFSSYLPF